jgi:hypothetical protein
MRKQWKGFIAGVAATLLFLGFAFPVFANYQKQATLYYKNIKVMLNGKEIVPRDEKGALIQPFIMNGTTYLPIRGIANALGLSTDWDPTINAVKLSNDATSTSSGYSRYNPAPIGKKQTITVQSYSGNYNVSITIVDSTRGYYAWQRIKAVTSFNEAPPSDKEYVLVKIKATVNSMDRDSAVTFSNYNLKPYSSDNNSYDIISIVEPEPRFSGSLYVGGTLEGYAVYLVNKNDHAPKLVYGTDYDGSGGIWFHMT